MGKNFKCQTFHELSRESIFFLAPPPHPIRRGGVRGENLKVTKHQVLKSIPGGLGAKNFKVTKHQVLKSIPGIQLSCAIITLQIFWAKPGNPREGGKKGVTNGEGEVDRERPEQSRVTS